MKDGLYERLRAAIKLLFRFRGVEAVTCPETGYRALVDVDSLHAAWTVLDNGHAHLRVTTCSRWPERCSCSEACLRQASCQGSQI